MVQPLAVSRLIRVNVNLSPIAAARRTFGTLLIVGDSPVINAAERLRSYTTLAGVAADFGTTAPEYLAAQLYYGQTPKPLNLQIGRWFRTAAAGLLQGGVLTANEQALAPWQAITNGTMTLDVDGTPRAVTALNLSTITNLNGIASAITAKLSPNAVATWDGQRFLITSATTGITSTVGYATPTGSGTDVSALLKLTNSTALNPIDGVASETPVTAVTSLMNQSAAWFGLMFAASTQPTDDQAVAVGQLIEAQDIERVFGWTILDTRVLDSVFTTDVGSRMEALGLSHSTTQFAANPYAIASMFGRAFSVNFSANRSVITLMYKQQPGVAPELITESQAQTLRAKNVNVFVQYDNDTAILQYGTMANGAWFDEVHGLAWFRNALQNSLFNLFYQSGTKVPQTDAGVNQVRAQAALACEESINNGLVAPGVWNADGFGQLKRGDTLNAGYYIFINPIALQPQAERETRVGPPMQIALKLAGAIQELDVIVNVNR